VENWGQTNDINMELTWDTGSEPPAGHLAQTDADIYYRNPLATEDELMALA